MRRALLLLLFVLPVCANPTFFGLLGTSVPRPLSGTTNGSIVTITFSLPVYIGGGGSGGFILHRQRGLSSLSAAMTLSSGAGTTTLTFACPLVLQAADVCDVVYTQPGNGAESQFGVDVRNFGLGITNTAP